MIWFLQKLDLYLIFVLGIFCYLTNTAEIPKNTSQKSNVCLTPGCVKTAARILEYIDPTVKPCDDFYHFACGTFIKNSIIADDRTSITQFNLQDDKVELQLRSLIEEPIQENELKPLTYAKKLYKICMNMSRIEEQGLTEIRKVIKKLGGYPVLEGDEWNEHSFNWIETNYKLWDLGFSFSYFIDFGIGVDLKNSTKKMLNLDSASLGLKREFLIKGLDEKIVSAYYNYIVDIAVIFGADRIKATAELYDALQLQIALANLSLPAEKRRDSNLLYNPMTVKELQIRYPSIPWLKYINTIMGPHNVIGDDEVILVAVPQYITDVEALLAKTPKRVQANYIINRALHSTLGYLTKEITKRKTEFSQAVSGVKAKVARWKECVSFASSIGYAIGGAYVKKHFNEETKKSAEEMIVDLKTAFTNILKKVDWMDEKTRKTALDKAESMHSFVAYPNELLDDKVIMEYYDGLEIDENSYLTAALSLSSFGKLKTLSEFRDPINKTDWRNHGNPADVNAYYSPLENSIELPAGILQGIFFEADRPKYINYGAIGFAIGHEITHGFDDEGKQFDKNGNLVEWWEPETKQAFEKQAQCIIQQYGNYTFPKFGLSVNGIKTQGENIADNGGLKESYQAYQNWIRRNGPEQMLPGIKIMMDSGFTIRLNYTTNQLFFISAASIWCSKARDEYAKIKLMTQVHTMEQYRVNGPMSNSGDFEREWKCPLRSKMNPIKKCSVW